ncbi:MAG: hypothetical protein ABFC38_12910 [Methanospirillum sp.]
MRCDTCGKEFQTYNRICPYCHARAGAVQGPPPVAPAPPVQSSAGSAPPIRPAPIAAAESPPAAQPVRPDYRGPSGGPPGRALKKLLACGFVLLVVLVAWVAFVSVPGLFPLTLTLGNAPAPAATDIPLPTVTAVTARPTVATAAPTRSADTPGPYSADPDATRRVAPGYRTTPGTRAPATATTEPGRGSIVGGVTPSPTDSVARPNWTGGDKRYVGYFYPYLSSVEEHIRTILASSLGNDWPEVRNGSEELKRTTQEGISGILPLPVSPHLSDVKNQSLGILDRLASGSDRFIAAADAHARGDEIAAGSLIVNGSGEIIRATGELERIREYLPKDLAAPN